MQTTASRMKVFVYGLVQGIGFRPFVYNSARELDLCGFVRNNGGVVEIEVEGLDCNIQTFIEALRNKAPALARITRIDTESCEPKGDTSEFRIEKSLNDQLSERYVPADTATCSECLNELFSHSDRRFQYPFINCTNCGPRFTIIESLPYDRASTTMKEFQMCNECEAEYKEPSNRRFHAQPNACWKCGPKLQFRFPSAGADDESPREGLSALDAAKDFLASGQVIAVKGLGGYHLMADARNGDAIEIIRNIKSRRDRPLAVMFANVDEVEKYCLLSSEERKLLEDSARPIVLLRQREKSLSSLGLHERIAPGLDEIGAMLPYTPLHHLLARSCDFPLLATSANEGGVPIVISDEAALLKFGSIGLLLHDREIHSGYDDSIQRTIAGRAFTLRRARGFAPAQIELPFESKHSVIAVGAHLKNTFCLTKDVFARVSQHLGDIDTIERLDNYERTLELYERLFDIHPQAVAHDLHPVYQTTVLAESLAKKLRIPLVGVQHHHAHAVGVMAEHRIERALAVVFDGLGLGSDGNLWGGEFLLSGYDDFERLAHFENVSMPGGEAAIKNPWRMALGFILSGTACDAEKFSSFTDSLRKLHSAKEVSAVISQIDRSFNAPLTSSCGRLFDAAAALVFPALAVTYEGQAAMQLEALARRCQCRDVHCFDYEIEKTSPYIVRTLPILASMQESLQKGLAPECAARAFHMTVVRIIIDVLLELRRDTGLSTVCFSGGVFQNSLLLESLQALLPREKFLSFFAQQLPSNDGGLSYGQAVIALARLNNLDQYV